MYKIDEIKMLRLGQRDENLAREIQMDASDWLELYPGASIAILFRRPGESTITPMITTLEGATLTWQINDFEVGITGVGNAEIRAVDVAGLRRKSRIIPCSIEETLLGDDETVLYTQDQVDITLAHIGEAAQSALAAKASEDAAALSAENASGSADAAQAAQDAAESARDAAQAAQTAAETAQHQAEAAQDGVHADAEAAAQAKVAAQAAQASAQGAASQASADRTAAESARADAEAAAEHAEEVVEGIDQAGADQVAAVNAAGQAQVTAVNAAGTTQVGNVNTAGTTQVNAVQAKGTEVINSIPADYSQMSTDVTNLKSALNDLSESVDTGILETTKDVSWINAYVNTGGVIINSTASRTGLVTLNAGDIVKIGTRSTNITIIGSTTSDSIAVGDSVTPIERTSSVDQYEEYTYTATSTINIVVCVRASEYNLSFYKITDVYKEVSENTENLESITPVLNILSAQNFVKVTRPLVINGMLDTTTGKRTYNPSQVNSYCITPDLLHVAKDSYIVKSSSVTMRVYFYNKDDEYVEYVQIGTGTTKYSFTNDCYVRLFFLVTGYTNTKSVYDNVTFNLVLYDYEPYSTFSFLGLSGESPNIHSSTSGDASLIQFSNGEVMEIDFHRDDQNNYQYYRDALSLRGVKRLDYIVFTHWHDDHWGLFEKALEYGYINIDGAVAFLPQELTTELAMQRGWESYKQKQDEITSILENHNCTIVRPKDGDKLKIDDVEIEWYNCDHSVYNTSGDYYSTNYNDWSLCFNLRKQNTIINYSADLGPVGQRYNAGKLPKCTILKAMHHGWDNGVNNLIPAFINNISPDIVIAENGYEHRPNSGLDSSISNAKSPIYSWAEANGVPAYPTNINGNINVVANNYGYRLNGHYTRFIRNDKNWSYTDNTEHIET